MTYCSVQELLLARQVSIWCGSRTIDDFPVLETAARLSQMISCIRMLHAGVKAMAWKDEDAQQAAEKKLGNAHVLFMIKYIRERAMGGTLSLFAMTRWFDATDRRDKIFALVRLTNDIDRSFVDYSRSYEEVIKELNLMFLDGRIGSMGCVLDIWSFITRAEEEDITQPSWVVDLLKVLESKYTAMMTAYATYEKSMIERTPELQFVERDGKEVRSPSFLISAPIDLVLGHRHPRHRFRYHNARHPLPDREGCCRRDTALFRSQKRTWVSRLDPTRDGSHSTIR